MIIEALRRRFSLAKQIAEFFEEFSDGAGGYTMSHSEFAELFDMSTRQLREYLAVGRCYAELPVLQQDGFTLTWTHLVFAAHFNSTSHALQRLQEALDNELSPPEMLRRG